MSYRNAGSLSFRILGPLEAVVGDRRVVVGGHQQSTLLGLLLAHSPRLVPMSQLIDTLWDDRPPDSAKRLLQNSVSALRRAFVVAGAGTPVIVADGPGYRVVTAPGALDADVFAELVASAGRLADAGDPGGAVEHLVAALELWRGPALFGLQGRAIEAAAARLDDTRLAAVEQRFDLELRLGRHDRVVGELTDLVVAHPLRERLVGQLMVALHRSGRPAEAVRAFHRLRTELRDELGIDPGPEIRQTYAEVLRRAPGSPDPAATATRPADRRVIVPAQLPMDVNGFTGRAAALRTLDEMLAAMETGPAGVAVAAVAGMPGVGKTALAVHWAHRVRARFPDGQRFVDLGGHGLGEPLCPDAGLGQLLHGLGVPGDKVPGDVQATARLYRTVLAGRRVLVLLDNARDAEQVLPLLPGAPGCFALVTSRDQLSGLVTAAGARPVALDLIGVADAHGILAHRIGPRRVNREPAAAERILRYCARLPLALVIVAARAAARPGFPLAAIADELGNAGERLDPFDGGAPALDLRTILSWSYARLDPPAARMFRLLGLTAGPDIGLAAAASLAGTPIRATRRILAGLARTHLVGERTPGRYHLHDLVMAYAAELGTADPPGEQRAAIHRLLDHYLHSALAAMRLTDPGRLGIDGGPAPVSGALIAEVDSLPAALAWFATERRALLASANLAPGWGFDEQIWRLAWVLGPVLDRGGHWRDSITLHRAGIAAARRLGERVGEVSLHRGIATAYKDVRAFADAEVHAQEAVRLARELPDRLEEAAANLGAGGVYEAQGRFREAVPHVAAARALFNAAGDPRREGFALAGLAHLYLRLGDHERALESCAQAIAPHRDIAAIVRASVLNTRGQALSNLGEYDLAVRTLIEARELFREFQYPVYEAVALNHLGDCHEARADRGAASAAWQAAIDVLTGVDDATALLDEVRAKLRRLDESDPERARPAGLRQE